MSQPYNLFKTHASTALANNDSAAAMDIVNDPEGVDLAGTEHDQPRRWSWFRDQVGNEAAITVRSAVEKVVAAKPANPDEDTATAYLFASNAQAILLQLDSVGISPCDGELRRALRTIIQVNPGVAEAFTAALRTGYQSPAQSMLGRDATAEDFAEARTEHLKFMAISTAISTQAANQLKHRTAINRLENLKAVQADYTLEQIELAVAEIEAFPAEWEV